MARPRKIEPIEQTKPQTVEVLVLSRCHLGKCGAVVVIPRGILREALANGLVDDNPTAVQSAKG
jgi:hypothetical protein